MTKTERLRKEIKVKKDFKPNRKGLIPSVKKIETKNKKPKPLLYRIKCNKGQPLQPTKTGITKKVPKKMAKQVKPILRNG
jgi:hypothetical protein